MDAAQWRVVQTLFHQACELPRQEWAGFLSASSGDPEIASRVLAMLEEDANASSILDQGVASAAAAIMEPEGEISWPMPDFGPYRILRVLGEGGMGVVYLARREDLNKLAAIKVLRDAWMSPSRRKRFAEEQRTLASLEHPSIARLYDAGTLADGTPWFVMEYADGVPITEYCEREGLTIEQRLDLFRQVCAAAAFAHERNIVHRDLKPSNILVRSGGSVCLLDFGIAKHVQDAEAPPDPNRTVTRIMTPAYASPEQLRGEPATVKSDVYSLGVILNELVTGRASGGLDAILRQAAHPDPDQRYETADALASDIARFLSNEPILARVAPPTWRRAALAASVVIVVLTLWAVARRSTPVPSAPTKVVAVVPFQHAGSDPGLDFLKIAIADQVATTLSYNRAIALRPMALTRRYTAPDLDIRAAATELNASVIVTGHYLAEGGELRITIEAFDAATDQLAWRDSFATPMNNRIAMQSLIAARARGGLASLFGSSGWTPSPATLPRNEEAYDLYLRSTALPLDPDPGHRAIGMLEKSVGLDPGFAPAWLTLARHYYVEGRYAKAGSEMMRRYDAATRRALDLAPDSMGAGAALVLSLTERGELAQAHSLASGMVGRRSDSADAHFALSYVLRYAGLLDESARECDAAFTLDAQTQTTGVKSCAVVFLLKRDYPRAMDFVRLDGGSEWARALTANILVRQGKTREALESLGARPPVWGGFPVLHAALSNQAVPPAAEDSDPEVNYFTATHLAYARQVETALDLLAKAIRGGYCSYPVIGSDPLLDNLRAVPEFQKTRADAAECQRAFTARRLSSKPAAE